MKKILSIGLAMFFALSSSVCAADNANLQQGVAAYKAANYTGCIQNMVEVIKDDPSNALAHYYIGMSHIKLGHKDMGTKAYAKVVKLNTNPHLTKLAQNGLNKINHVGTDEAQNAKEPEKRELTAKDAIDRRVKYLYEGNHFATEKCEDTIRQIELNNQKNEVNAGVMLNKQPENNESDETSFSDDEVEKKNLTYENENASPTDKEIADAVKVLAKVGFMPYQGMGYPIGAINSNNAEMAQLQMMLGRGYNGNDMISMLPYIVSAQNQSNNQNFQNNINPEYIKTMMMTDMMGNLNGSFFNSGAKNTY